ncbi:hypothetical protein J3R30DRAFT_714877 [Lentinula aciculospora]|uniref:Uncharacterized protein n=1 Tax=Lentinula aciculospora TaxID=153920 RepID=A0A9W9A4D7_9AGAR|nr:hypothetical protein J3R30DRAFT_714877 [Lentinula aciculospora]
MSHQAVKYYPQLKSAFQYIVPVGVSLNKTKPYLETNYSLPTFEQYISGTTVTGSRISPVNSTSAVPSSSITSASSHASSISSTSSSSNGGSTASTNGAYKAADLGSSRTLSALLIIAQSLGRLNHLSC